MNKELNITINVYDEDDNVVKTVSAEPVKFKFGAIRSLMELLNIEDTANTTDLLKTVYNAWDQLKKVLSKCFPEITYEEWEYVELNELVPAVLQILEFSFGEIFKIPRVEKN